MLFNDNTIDTLYRLSLYTKPVGVTALARAMEHPYQATHKRIMRLVEAENVENVGGHHIITVKGRRVLALLLEIRSINEQHRAEQTGVCNTQASEVLGIVCR